MLLLRLLLLLLLQLLDQNQLRLRLRKHLLYDALFIGREVRGQRRIKLRLLLLHFCGGVSIGRTCDGT